MIHFHYMSKERFEDNSGKPLQTNQLGEISLSSMNARELTDLKNSLLERISKDEEYDWGNSEAIDTVAEIERLVASKQAEEEVKYTA